MNVVIIEQDSVHQIEDLNEDFRSFMIGLALLLVTLFRCTSITCAMNTNYFIILMNDMQLKKLILIGMS
jgi:hypothetical protein